MKSKILDVVRFLYERSEETAYGPGPTEDPHDFTPDPECATPEEIERHRLACEAWARGDAMTLDAAWTGWPSEEEAKAYVRSCMERGATAATISGPGADPHRWIVHCHVGGWGFGTYTLRDPEMLEMARKLEAIAADMPDDGGDHA
jgi:hypothetical protein